ncbi:hypothetical protein [Ruegeria sp.]|uniref:hypothetical protein n=1 Tax=Ruegeria sp. TaxID=1879320 RepID=UPI0023145888|nr:hypothetical protein [Ruegeria sp.]MDA7964991.1 hypothetical protein [Ruegeria sp.]
MNIVKRAASIVALLVPSVAFAEPTPQEVCQKMIEEDRSGDIVMEECLCTYQVADTVLDDDIKALLFDAWYTGNNNTEKMKALPNPKRINKQFKTMERTMRKNCNITR